MLNICICEEDIQCVESVKKQLLGILENVPYVVTVFNDLDSMQQAMMDLQMNYDIMIFGIQFGNRTSLKLIESINERYPNIQIIIMSKYIGMLLNVYDVECCYFIYKEELGKRLPKAIAKARKNLELFPRFITIKQGKEHIIIRASDIVYIEHLAKKCTIHTLTDEIEIISTLKDLEDYLDPDHFFHTHKSYIVNSDHIKKVTLAKIEVANDIVLPVSRNYRQSIRSFIELHTKPEK